MHCIQKESLDSNYDKVEDKMQINEGEKKPQPSPSLWQSNHLRFLSFPVPGAISTWGKAGQRCVCVRVPVHLRSLLLRSTSCLPAPMALQLQAHKRGSPWRKLKQKMLLRKSTRRSPALNSRSLQGTRRELVKLLGTEQS